MDKEYRRYRDKTDWEKEMEKLRSRMRRSNKRNSLSVDPHGPLEMFVVSDDYIFENIYLREIRELLSKEQFEFYSLLLKGYNLKECADILGVSYMTVRRGFKKLKSIVESIFSL